MTNFPENHPSEASIAQAYIDPTTPAHGYIRFVADEKVRILKLPRRAFVQLARDIQRADSQQDGQTTPQSQANDQ